MANTIKIFPSHLFRDGRVSTLHGYAVCWDSECMHTRKIMKGKRSVSGIGRGLSKVFDFRLGFFHPWMPTFHETETTSFQRTIKWCCHDRSLHVNFPSLPPPSDLFLQAFYQQLKCTPVKESLFGLFCILAGR